MNDLFVLQSVWLHNQCAVPERLTSYVFQMILWHDILLSRSVCWHDSHEADANQLACGKSSRKETGLFLLCRHMVQICCSSIHKVFVYVRDLQNKYYKI